MTQRGVLIIGSGERVSSTALPAFQRLQDRFSIRRVFARTRKRIRAGNSEFEVESTEDIAAADLAEVDLVYIAVTTAAVPAVLDRLRRFDLSRLDLLIDTPVVSMRDFRHARRLASFRNAWVAEDCVELPWFDPVFEVVERGEIGTLSNLVFFHAAYGFHAVAISKRLLAGRRLRSARRKPLGPHFGYRCMWFEGGASSMLFEPRDYASGRVALLGSKGSIIDYVCRSRRSQLVEPVVRGGRCVGFRVGEIAAHLPDDEVELMGLVEPGTRVTQQMSAMKRVGFARLLKRVHDGRGAYPVEEALEDSLVDTSLVRLGRYVATPLANPRSPLGRRCLGALARVLS